MKSTVDWKLGVWWSLATIGGLILGLIILFAGLGAAINNAPPFVFGLVLGCTFGFGCAVMQWVALRRLVSAWWILANVLGWSIGAALGDGIKAALGSEDPIDFVVVFIVSTVVTAIVLVKMFRDKVV